MKGTYCLLIEVSKDSSIIIGKLGEIEFKKGIYLYVGSALNNLEKRVERYLNKRKKKFWHIDYLLGNKNVDVKKVYRKKSKKEECSIAREIAKYGEAIKNFGCSDCKCISHLFRINDYNSLMSKLEKLNLKI